MFTNRRRTMTCTFVLAFLLTATVAAISVAGTIEGKVSGVSGLSVVYVDTVFRQDFSCAL
jgi:hypothetical protein